MCQSLLVASYTPHYGFAMDRVLIAIDGSFRADHLLLP